MNFCVFSPTFAIALFFHQKRQIFSCLWLGLDKDDLSPSYVF